jgi:hypothetical protein
LVKIWSVWGCCKGTHSYGKNGALGCGLGLSLFFFGIYFIFICFCLVRFGSYLGLLNKYVLENEINDKNMECLGML